MKKKTVKLFSLFLCGVMLLLCLGGCRESEKDNKKLRIVATIFPEYDWTREILGSNPADAELTLLLSSGVDMHSFQPSMDDIVTISTCDIFIYVGGESDAWVRDALSQATNKDIVAISLLDALGDQVREEEILEGLESEEEEEEESGEPEYDEHVWLSMRNASLFCDAIESALSKKDSANADTYRKNKEAYQQKLGDLDREYTSAVGSAASKTLIIGDRFPFRYLTEDYGLEYYAAFSGCSAETEASPDTIIFLAQKADELNAKSIIKTEGSDGSVAETIKNSTKTKDQTILTLDSMQSVTSKDVDAGCTYLSVMQSDLKVLKQALG